MKKTVNTNTRNIKTRYQLCFLIMMSSILFACAPTIKKEKTAVAKAPVEKVESIPATKPVSTPKPVVPPVVSKSEPESVLVLLSSSASAYQKVAAYLSQSLGENVVQITLSGLPAQDVAVIKDIENSNTSQIVALGSKAIDAIKHIENKQIIYTQVTNYNGVFADNIKAVSALPSPEKLFEDWKALSPGTTKVAVAAGDGLDLYLNRATLAAKKNGIKLVVVKVKSDKEFLYKSKKLANDITGQWILPDNRVLSVKALKEVMAFASRRGRQVVVFSPKLLPFGGFFYVSPDAQAIAKGVLQRLSDSVGHQHIKGKNVLPVMHHVMGINQKIAEQFNLTIPMEYRVYLNE